MNLDSLRGLVRSLNFATHGIDATIEPGDSGQSFDPFPIRGIWLTPTTDDLPSSGFDLHTRERAYILAIPLVEVPARGVIVLAPRPAFDAFHGEMERWRVDGIAQIEADHVRWRLIPDPLEAT